MQSSGESIGDNPVCWSEVRHLVNQDCPANESIKLRTWASGVSALKRLSTLHSEIMAALDPFTATRVGEYGICRFRTLRLANDPGNFEKPVCTLNFGDLYQIKEISSQRGWLQIRVSESACGWIENSKHFGLSNGECKILAALKRSHRANFLVNAISNFVS